MNKTLCLALSVAAVFVLILSAMPRICSAADWSNNTMTNSQIPMWDGQSLKWACAGDALNLCPGMKPGDGQLMNCLMQRLCPDLAPGAGVGQLMDCLVQNETQLSPAVCSKSG